MASCVKRQPIQSEIEKTIDERPAGMTAATPGAGFHACGNASAANQSEQPFCSVYLHRYSHCRRSGVADFTLDWRLQGQSLRELACRAFLRVPGGLPANLTLGLLQVYP
jgi:hypothetical protein